MRSRARALLTPTTRQHKLRLDLVRERLNLMWLPSARMNNGADLCRSLELRWLSQKAIINHLRWSVNELRPWHIFVPREKCGKKKKQTPWVESPLGREEKNFFPFVDFTSRQRKICNARWPRRLRVSYTFCPSLITICVACRESCRLCQKWRHGCGSAIKCLEARSTTSEALMSRMFTSSSSSIESSAAFL